MPSEKYVYRLVREGEWPAAQATGVYPGIPLDHNDGYIHFSCVCFPGRSFLGVVSSGAQSLLLRIDGAPYSCRSVLS